MQRYISWFTNLYPVWTIAVSVLALMNPATLVWFNPYVVAALGFVMLNMGLTLSVKDFKSLGKMPGSVAVGFILHYTIMPLSGWAVAHWLKLDPQLQYIPFGVGDPVIGVGIGVIVESRAKGFTPGMLVTGLWGWERFSLADPTLIQPIAPDERIPLEAHLSIFSHVGQAAVCGLIGVAGIKPGGCRTVGIAGGARKCEWLRNELGLDDAIDYRSEPLPEAVARTCPNGVDVYFDNVGGELLDAVLTHIRNAPALSVMPEITLYYHCCMALLKAK